MPHWHAVVAQDDRIDAEERPVGASRFQRVRAGQRRDEDAAGLGLPPGVDDRAAFVADVFIIPDPRFGVDGFAHAAEHPQCVKFVLLAATRRPRA